MTLSPSCPSQHPKATEAFQRLGSFVRELDLLDDSAGSWQRAWQRYDRSRGDAADIEWEEGSSCGSWGGESSEESQSMDVEQPQGPPAAGNDPPPAWLTTEQVQQAAAQAAVQHAAQIQSHAQLQAQTAQMSAPAAGHAMHAAQATQAAGPTPMPYGLPSPMGAASGVWVPVMMAPEPALQPVPTAMTPAAPPAPPSMPPAPAALSAPAGLARDGTARRQEVEELLVSARVALRSLARQGRVARAGARGATAVAVAVRSV